MSDYEQELLELGREQTRREKEIRDEWFKTHERRGYDSGPTRQLIKIREEYRKRFLELRKKYGQSISEKNE